MSDVFETGRIMRPQARRPDTGLQAWYTTIGYMSQEHSPDAILRLMVSAADSGKVTWTASVAWADQVETLSNQSSPGTALQFLWVQLAARHAIFKKPSESWRSPVDYAPGTWLDEATDKIVQRLVSVTGTSFKSGWRITTLYQPVGQAETRLQATLYANEDKVKVYARGSSLREVCQNLYRNAASHFASTE
jgi:hypothetical protein